MIRKAKQTFTIPNLRMKKRPFTLSKKACDIHDHNEHYAMSQYSNLSIDNHIFSMPNVKGMPPPNFETLQHKHPNRHFNEGTGISVYSYYIKCILQDEALRQNQPFILINTKIKKIRRT